FHPLLMLGDIHQLDQQAVLDKRHQQSLSHFAQMTAQGAEELAFRGHRNTPHVDPCSLACRALNRAFLPQMTLQGVTRRTSTEHIPPQDNRNPRACGAWRGLVWLLLGSSCH